MTPLVLLPGLLCDAEVWAAQTAGLADVADCRVADLTRDDSMSGMAARVLKEAPSGRFALAGFSMGGYVAFEIMRQAPDRVMRLALLGTSARTDSGERREERRRFIELARRPRRFMPITRAMLGMLVHPSRTREEALTKPIIDMAARVGVQAYIRQQVAMLDRPDSVADLRGIRCPTLVLAGREDGRAPPAVQEEIRDGIEGAELVILENCGHMAPMERPELVNGAMRRWLSSPAGGA
ncbi:MAG: alpha/beta hydrolase [Betaproteobacteria bacterium]|nr:alpha/beta hydrolase [Betaproteobacteria bacterium]